MYFVTICTQGRLPLFGRIVGGEMVLNDAGCVAEQCWRAIPEHFPRAFLDEFVVMPNHVHGIIRLGTDEAGANDHLPLRVAQPPHGTSQTVGAIVRGFKIGVTRWFKANKKQAAVWQRNYYEHIIRNEAAYLEIAEYIQTNPLRWEEDVYHV
jgi:putative transposase